MVLRRAQLSTVAVLASLVLASPPVSGQTAEGTYDVDVFAPGGGDNRVVAELRLVLSPGPVQLDSLSRQLAEAATRSSHLLMLREGGEPTACFGFAKSPRYVEGREFYGGIIPYGFSHWVQSGDSVHIRVYQSPDASQTLMGRVMPEGFAGRVNQHDSGGRGSTEWMRFRARRVGPVSATECDHALALGSKLEREGAGH